jgi:hypothetical protein
MNRSLRPFRAVSVAGIETGSAKANRREPKTYLGRVFNNKLGCFDDVHELIYVDARPDLKLKTRPK